MNSMNSMAHADKTCAPQPVAILALGAENLPENLLGYKDVRGPPLAGFCFDKQFECLG